MAKNKVKLNGEISYDFVMSDDMGWIDGCYRLPYRNWEVVCIIKEEGISKPNYKLRDASILAIELTF